MNEVNTYSRQSGYTIKRTKTLYKFILEKRIEVKSKKSKVQTLFYIQII